MLEELDHVEELELELQVDVVLDQLVDSGVQVLDVDGGGGGDEVVVVGSVLPLPKFHVA